MTANETTQKAQADTAMTIEELNDFELDAIAGGTNPTSLQNRPYTTPAPVFKTSATPAFTFPGSGAIVIKSPTGEERFAKFGAHTVDLKRSKAATDFGY